ncbi:MAG: DUF885 domain-containing protein [Candidatus Zixiibacteriota bacterium]|nr:MAG: DUF885 domain-containing protein [candidate division Zixibacteria bacterium]
MYRLTICLLAALFLTLPPQAEARTNKTRFDALAAQILESLQAFYPVRATEKGIHTYDHKLADYSQRSVNRMISRLDSFEKKLYRYRNVFRDPEDRINYELIKSDVDVALLDLKRIKWYRRSPMLYVDEATNGIYLLMVSRYAPLSERLISILGRMKQVPGLFATARRNLRKPPQVWKDLALESLESTSEFYRQVASELMNKFPERADEILKYSTAAREAMNDFANYLRDMPTGSPTAFAINKQNYDYLLAHQYFLSFDADSLLRIGETLLEKARRDYDAYREYMDEHYQNGTDSVFVPASFNRQDILDYYGWEVNQVKLFLRTNNLLSVPEDIAPVEVVETPPFLRSMIPGIAYQPAGPFDSVQVGYFYVRPIPKDLDRRQLESRYRYVYRRGFKGSVVHEAYPGHHLQMQIAGRHPSPIRKWNDNTMMIEGWALYCEEMMYHAGLYGDEDPPMWLAILGGIRFRAARIVADVKLHTGKFTYQQCVDWMSDVLEAESESEKDYIKRSVRKYTATPTVWMSYLMGKREIQRLHDSYMAAHPQATDKEFYDAMLAEGSIPPTLMWDALGLKPVAAGK